MGILADPDLHDGFVETLHVAGNKSANVECRTVNGAHVVIHFDGIRAMTGNNFREGNIIHTIRIYEGIAIPDDEIKLLLFNAYSKQEVVSTKIEQLHNSNDKFVQFVPSYGLELKVLCGELRFELRS